MFRVLHKSIPLLMQRNRFFSVINTDALSRLCQMPRIKAAMQKEGLIQKKIAWTQLLHHIEDSEGDVSFDYLEHFETNNRLYEIYSQGWLSFTNYALSTRSERNKILLFLSQCANVSHLLEKKYINLDRHLKYLRWPIHNLFNPKFCQYMLDTRKISLDKYINRGQLDLFYALSDFFLKADFESFFADGSLSIDQLLLLKKEDIYDLTWLLSSKDWDAHQWIKLKYLTMDQFLECSTYDRKGYMAFMYCRKEYMTDMQLKNDACILNFTLEYFLLLNESTRRTFRFDQSYITPEVFNTFELNLQLSMRDSLFSNMGRYALNKRYINIEQYASLSQEARDSLSTIFTETDKIYWDAVHRIEEIDRIFSNGFDFDQFDALAKQSKEKAIDYLWNEKNQLEPGTPRCK